MRYRLSSSRPQSKLSTGWSRRSFSTRLVSLTGECPRQRIQVPLKDVLDGAGDAEGHPARPRMLSIALDSAQRYADPPVLRQHGQARSPERTRLQNDWMPPPRLSTLS